MNIQAERFPRPPDKRETAAPASTGNGGNIFKTSPNHYNAPAARTQPTPCHKCKWHDRKFVDRKKLPFSVRRWTGCYLAAHRDPGIRCRYFLNSRGGGHWAQRLGDEIGVCVEGQS